MTGAALWRGGRQWEKPVVNPRRSATVVSVTVDVGQGS